MGAKSSNDDEYTETPDMTTSPAMMAQTNDTGAPGFERSLRHRGSHGGLIQLVVPPAVAGNSVRRADGGQEHPMVANVPLGPGGLPRLDLAMPRNGSQGSLNVPPPPDAGHPHGSAIDAKNAAHGAGGGGGGTGGSGGSGGAVGSRVVVPMG